MLTVTKTQPGRYARRSSQSRRPMRATWPGPPVDRVDGSVIARHPGRARREAHCEQPGIHRRLETLKLGAFLDFLIPSIVPMPRERAVVEIRAAGALLERLELRIRLPFGI